MFDHGRSDLILCKSYMKYIVRVFLFNVFALWFTSEIYPGFVIPSGWQTIVSSGFVLSILMIIVKPLLKILFIPINLITFGLFAWVVNVIVIYLLTIVVPQISITAWTFPGFTSSSFIISPFLLSYSASLIITTLGITVISHILHGLSEG